MKELLQVRVQAVYYLHEWEHPDPELRAEYRKIQAEIPAIERLGMADPYADWAMPKKPVIPEETGHEAP